MKTNRTRTKQKSHDYKTLTNQVNPTHRAESSPFVRKRPGDSSNRKVGSAGLQKSGYLPSQSRDYNLLMFLLVRANQYQRNHRELIYIHTIKYIHTAGGGNVAAF